jgi:hypothetical protein
MLLLKNFKQRCIIQYGPAVPLVMIPFTSGFNRWVEMNIRTQKYQYTNYKYTEFGKALCTYKRCWKWCPRASIQAWTPLILFANTFCRSAFGKSMCTYKRCWKWCPRASIQAWNRLILFANTFCRSACEMFLMYAVIAVSKNWIKQLHTLSILHFNSCLTTEYNETTAHFNGNFNTDNQIYVP